MSISSSSLVHFTTEREILKAILIEGFKVKYCVEKIYTPSGSLELAVPMVSFCNLPFSEVKDHMKNYGFYGVGLKRQWKGVNPVLYIDNGSTLGTNLWKVFTSFKDNGKALEDYSQEDFGLLDVLRYLKNTYGEVRRGEVQIPNYHYMDEKEWRYVPANTEVYPFIPAKIYLEDKRKFNDPISGIRLKFSAEDIAYIIVRNEVEIKDFAELFGEIYGDKSLLMVAKLVTSQQILRDF